MTPATLITLYRVLAELHTELADEVEKYPHEDQSTLRLLRRQIEAINQALRAGDSHG